MTARWHCTYESTGSLIDLCGLCVWAPTSYVGQIDLECVQPITLWSNCRDVCDVPGFWLESRTAVRTTSELWRVKRSKRNVWSQHKGKVCVSVHVHVSVCPLCACLCVHMRVRMPVSWHLSMPTTFYLKKTPRRWGSVWKHQSTPLRVLSSEWRVSAHRWAFPVKTPEWPLHSYKRKTVFSQPLGFYQTSHTQYSRHRYSWLENGPSLLTDHIFINPDAQESHAPSVRVENNYHGRQNPSLLALLGASALHWGKGA